MIQNYDTNGLVFLLNFEESSTNDEQAYKRAVLNILNAQKFSCIPLVDGPRIRSNTNNLTDRATYEEGGKVTHIARKGIYEGEEEIEIIPISEIKHVQGDCDLIEGLLLLFEERDDGICDFIITVGGTSEYPIALFTLNELKNSNTKEHLFRRAAYHGAKLGTNVEGTDFVNFAKMLYDNLEEIITSKNKKEIKRSREVLVRRFKEIPEEIDNYNFRKTSLIQSTNFANLCINDVMQMVMCGIEKNDDSKVIAIAREILSDANDFSNLAVYEDGILNPNQIYNKSRNESTEAKKAKHTDSLRELILSFDDNLKVKNLFAIVEPDPEIITGEEEWRYPGCITKQELFSSEAMLFYAASCVMIEKTIVKKLAPDLPIIGGKHNMILVYKEGEKKRELEEATLGELVHYINQEKLFTRTFPNAENKFTPNDLFQLKRTRNELVHFALAKCFGENPNLDHVTFKNIQSMIKIGESLNIYH